MITYTWSISRLDCAPSENGLTDVVKVIHWALTGIDENGVSASINNSYPLPSPTPEEFTDYSTLTEETVIGWLESNLDVGYLQSRLVNEIASKYNPPITSLPFPWIKVEEPIVVEEPVLEVIEEPVLEVIEEPIITEEPIVTEEPVVEEPIITEEPIVTEEPVVEEVVVEEPVVEEPVVEEVVVEEPVVEEVVVEEVVVEEPVIEEVVAD